MTDRRETLSRHQARHEGPRPSSISGAHRQPHCGGAWDTPEYLRRRFAPCRGSLLENGARASRSGFLLMSLAPRDCEIERPSKSKPCDRKSVVWGQRVTGRVDLGGGGRNKKKQ